MVKISPSYSNFFGISLRRVNLPRVSYPSKSYDVSRSYLKGQSNDIFNLFFSLQAYNEIFDLHFFHHLNQPEPVTNRLKYFRFWLRFCQVIRIFRKHLPEVSYCAESLMTPGSRQPFLITFAQCHKNKYGLIFYRKRATIFILEKSSRTQNVLTPRGIMGSQFFLP